MNRIRIGRRLATVGVFVLASISFRDAIAQTEPANQDVAAGKKIYADRCVTCHGDHGQGVDGKYDRPFSGSKSVEQLAALIDQTMPDDDPDSCVDADAASVAAFVKVEFMAEPAAEKPRIELVHLTVPQYENAVADIASQLLQEKNPGFKHGLQASFYDSKDANQDKLISSRVDSAIDGDLLSAEPFKNREGKDGFYVRWEGSVFAEETGTYQFIVRSPNGFRLFVNRLSEPLIDNWVATPSEPEHTAPIKLLGGRWYSIQLECFKFKESEFSIQLTWQRPGRLPKPIAAHWLFRQPVQPVVVVQTVFPADDSSVGYPRGTLVSKEWDAATTDAAVEVADVISNHLEFLRGPSPSRRSSGNLEGCAAKSPNSRFAAR